MQDCIKYTSSGYQKISLIKDKILGLKDEVNHLYPKTFFNSREEERRCHLMAIDQALDIVDAIEARFITGQSDKEPRGYRGKGYLYYENSNLFED